MAAISDLSMQMDELLLHNYADVKSDKERRYPKMVAGTQKSSNNHIAQPRGLKSSTTTVIGLKHKNCKTSSSPKSGCSSPSCPKGLKNNSPRPTSLPLVIRGANKAELPRPSSGLEARGVPNPSKACTRGEIKPYSVPGTPVGDDSLLKCYKELLIRFSRAQIAIEELSLKNSAHEETIKNWRPILRDAILIGNDCRSSMSSSKSSSNSYPEGLRNVLRPCDDLPPHLRSRGVKSGDESIASSNVSYSIKKCQDFLNKSQHFSHGSQLSQASSLDEINKSTLSEDVITKGGSVEFAGDQNSTENTILQNILQIQAIEEKLDALQQTFTIDDLMGIGSGETLSGGSGVMGSTFIQTWLRFKQNWNTFQENANSFIESGTMSTDRNYLDRNYRLGDPKRDLKVEDWDDENGASNNDDLSLDFLRSELARLDKKIESFQEAIYCIIDDPINLSVPTNTDVPNKQHDDVFNRMGLTAEQFSQPFEVPPECMTGSLDSQTSSIVTVIEKRDETDGAELDEIKTFDDDVWYNSAYTRQEQLPTMHYDCSKYRSPVYQTSTLKKQAKLAKESNKILPSDINRRQYQTTHFPYYYSAANNVNTGINAKLLNETLATACQNNVGLENRWCENTYAKLSRSDTFINPNEKSTSQGVTPTNPEHFNSSIYCTPYRDLNHYTNDNISCRQRPSKPSPDMMKKLPGKPNITYASGIDIYSSRNSDVCAMASLNVHHYANCAKHSKPNLYSGGGMSKDSSRHTKSYDDNSSQPPTTSQALNETYSSQNLGNRLAPSPVATTLNDSYHNSCHQKNNHDNCMPSCKNVCLKGKGHVSYTHGLHLQSINNSNISDHQNSFYKPYNNLAYPKMISHAPYKNFESLSSESKDLSNLYSRQTYGDCHCCERLSLNDSLHLTIHSDDLNFFGGKVAVPHNPVCACFPPKDCLCSCKSNAVIERVITRPKSLYSFKEKRTPGFSHQLKKLMRKSDAIYYLHHSPASTLIAAPCCGLDSPIILAEHPNAASKIKKTLKIKTDTLRLRLLKPDSGVDCPTLIKENYFSSTLSLQNTVQGNDGVKNLINQCRKGRGKDDCCCTQHHHRRKCSSTLLGDEDLLPQLTTNKLMKNGNGCTQGNLYETNIKHRSWKHGFNETLARQKIKKKKIDSINGSVKEKGFPKSNKPPKSTNDIKVFFQNIVNIFKGEQTSF